MHLDYGPDIAGGAVFPLLEMYADMLNGMSLVEGPRTFMLHLALDGPIPWQDPRLGEFAYVHAGSYVDDRARTYQRALAHMLPDSPLLVVGQTSVVDPTRVPVAGRHLVWIQVRTVPGQIRGDAVGQSASARDAAPPVPLSRGVPPGDELTPPGALREVEFRRIHLVVCSEEDRGR